MKYLVGEKVFTDYNEAVDYELKLRDELLKYIKVYNSGTDIFVIIVNDNTHKEHALKMSETKDNSGSIVEISDKKVIEDIVDSILSIKMSSISYIVYQNFEVSV